MNTENKLPDAVKYIKSLLDVELRDLDEGHRQKLAKDIARIALSHTQPGEDVRKAAELLYPIPSHDEDELKSISVGVIRALEQRAFIAGHSARTKGQ